MSDPRPITADIIDPIGGPAHSSVSDMPVIEAEPPPGPVPEPDPAHEPEPSPEPDEGGEPAPEPAAKPARPGIQQRFSELTAEKKVEIAKREAAEEYAARLERLLGERRREADPPPRQPDATPEPPRVEPRPRRDDFIDPDAYDAALDGWYTAQTARAVEVKLAERDQNARAETERQQQERQQTTAQEQERQIETIYQERAAKFSEEHPDYQEAVTRDDLPISIVMRQAILTNEEGPAAAYYLSEHPEIAQRIAAFNIPGMVFPQGHQFAGQPVPDIGRQLLEMGRVFASIGNGAPAAPAAPAAAPVSRTPAPPPPVVPIRRGSAPANNRSMQEVGDDPNGMADYAAQRMPQILAQRGPGYRG